VFRALLFEMMRSEAQRRTIAGVGVLAFAGLFAAACGASKPSPPSPSPSPSPASTPSTPTAALVGSAAPHPSASSTEAAESKGELTKEQLQRFVQAGFEASRAEPEDPGVIAVADRPLLKSSKWRAQLCLSKAKVRGSVKAKISLSDEGKPSAEPLSTDREIPAAVVRCILDALAYGRYTRPGTQTKEGITKRFIHVRVEQGMEEEYSVD
jgi:hypothetical protein